MEGLMDVVVKVMNSPVIQGVLTSASFLQIIAEALEKRRENRDTLETQAVYCFDRALYQFCTHYEMEYDCVAIAEIFSTNIGGIQKVNVQNYQDAILKTAIGVDSVSSEQRNIWYYYVDKTIAEEKLEILDSFLTLRRLRKKGDGIPQILTEKAPRPPVEEKLLSRTEEQQDILRTIQEKKKLVLVNGLGGVGKSTVCKELFYCLCEKNEQQLAWVTYNGISLEEDFITQFYYPKLLTERRKYIRYFLQNEIDENAIVFVDNLNVRDIDDQFIEILMKAKCNVVCTSRITDYRYFTTIPINLFLPNQCITLFKKYAHISTDEKDVLIEQIVQKVGLHTLTIEVLGKLAYCEEQTPKQILESLEEKGINLEGVVEVDLKEDTLVGHLCKIFPVDKLDDDKKYILSHFAMCPLEQIPKEIRNWIGISGKHNINYLKKYGWFIENENSYYMHPIIKQVVRKICSLGQEYYIELLKNLERLTKYDRNIGVEKALPYYAYVKNILRYVDDMIYPSVAWLYFNCAWIEKEQKQYDMAINNFKKAIQQWSHPIMKTYCDLVYINTRIVNIQVQIGTCYNEQGLTDEARSWYDKMFYSEDPYSDNELRAQIHNNYALTYQEDLRRMKEEKSSCSSLERLYHKSKKGFFRTIRGFQKLGKRDAFMGIAFRNLGKLYMDVGEMQKAIDCLEKALRIREKVLDENSPDRGKNYYDLGEAYIALAEELTSLRSKVVKYKIAYYYFELCYEICESNTRNSTNGVDLEKLELEMARCYRCYRDNRNLNLL